MIALISGAVMRREMAVAARARGTWRIRIAAAGVAALAACAGMLNWSVFPNGSILFSFLVWISFVMCVFAGVHYTRDSISGEREDGTLGLLLSTPVRGPGIVLAKLVTSGLRTAVALLAVVPMLGIPVLMGAVSGTSYSKAIVVLLNTLFVVTALGLAASALTANPSKSLGLAFGWVLLLLFGFLPAFMLPILFLSRRGAASNSRIGWREASIVGVAAVVNIAVYLMMLFQIGGGGFLGLGLGSPSYQLNGVMGTAWDSRFLISLGLVNALGWVFLWVAMRGIEGVAENGEESHWTAKKRTRARQRDGDVFVRRLLRLDRWIPWAIWATVILELLQEWAMALTRRAGGMAVSVGMSLNLLIFYFLVALAAAHFFARGRRDGTLELLLVTPVTRPEIVTGVLVRLRRMVLLPYLVLCAGFIGQYVIVILQSPALPSIGVFLGMALSLPVQIGLELLALIWVSLWLSWVLKRPRGAAFLAWAFGVVVPFVWTIIVFSTMAWLRLDRLPSPLAGWIFSFLGVRAIQLLPLAIAVLVARSRLGETFLKGDEVKLVEG